MTNSKVWRWVYLVVGVALVLGIDQITKLLVVDRLAMFESVQPIPALYPYFQITRSFNTGAAFGLLANTETASRVFLVIALVVSVVLVWSYRTLTPAQPGARLATMLVIGGALGNAIDRMVYGHVVDFIHYTLPGVISNVSNIADHAIVGGVFLMIIASWRTEQQPQPDTAPESDTLPDTGNEVP